jgi:hypothetical protein
MGFGRLRRLGRLKLMGLGGLRRGMLNQLLHRPIHAKLCIPEDD